jgi:hypothetical protein
MELPSGGKSPDTAFSVFLIIEVSIGSLLSPLSGLAPTIKDNRIKANANVNIFSLTIVSSVNGYIYSFIIRFRLVPAPNKVGSLVRPAVKPMKSLPVITNAVTAKNIFFDSD